MKDKLTVTQIEALKTKGKPYKVFDGGGLYVLVHPNRSKYWRLKYRYGGKEKTLALGVYAKKAKDGVTLAEAREKRDEAKARLKAGADPSITGLETGRTFENVAREWHEQQKALWSTKHANQVIHCLERDIFPEIGKRAIDSIEPPDVLKALRKIERRGAIEVAKRTAQRVSAVFQYGIASGLVARDAAADVRGALKKRKPRSYPALGADEFPKLIKKIHSYDGDPVTRLALRLMALTFVRTSELIGARWAEFSRADAIWIIPGERMKGGLDHLVPLARQTLELLDELEPLTGHSEFLFPNRASAEKTMSNNTMLYALYRLGYHGRATGHGFRSSASTILNEAQKKVGKKKVPRFSPDAIERQLAHVPRDKVRAAYNRAEYLDQRIEMMQWWADYLMGNTA